MRNCIKYLEFLLHIRRVTKYVYLIWSKPSKEHMMKSGQEKYSKWFNLQSFKRFGICKYHLCDLDGEDIKGTFYEAELQLVDYLAQGSFEIEKVIEKRGCGKKEEVLVKWKGWPEKFNSWILTSDLQS